MTMANFLLSLLLIAGMGKAQVRDVCDALSALSDLNGKQVQIRGAWLIGDSGEMVWSVSQSKVPITRDGWQWPVEAINIAPLGGVKSILESYSKWRELGRGGNSLVLATFSGQLVTNARFKVSRSSHLPMDFAYCVAEMLFETVEDLQAIPLSDVNRSRLRRQQVSPFPIKLPKK